MNVRFGLNTNFLCFYACFNQQHDASHDISIKYTKQDSLLLKKKKREVVKNNEADGSEKDLLHCFFFLTHLMRLRCET